MSQIKRNDLHSIRETLPSQSKFHELIRRLLLECKPLASLKIFQEVNPLYIIQDYPYRNHHYDFYIESLDVIIECHGEQHYTFSNRGNVQYEEAFSQWKKGLSRDSIKKKHALKAGLTYVEIPYSMRTKITADKLYKLILGNENDS